MGEDTPTSSLANKMDKRRATGTKGLKKPQLSQPPTTSDLKAMVDDALMYAGQIIELPFRDGQDEYYLTCVSGRKREEPLMWVFYIGNGPSAQVALVYETADVSLLQNMVECAMPTQTKAGGGMSVAPPTPLTTTTGTQIIEKGAMEGLLAKMPIANLLQSLAGADATGKLVITRGQHVAIVYFDGGKLVHCESDQMIGEDGVLDLLFWKDGMFNFFPDQNTKVQTVKRRLEGMLMESANLQDFSTFLEKREIGVNSFLTRQVNNDQQYAELMKNAVPTDEQVQLKFAKSINGTRTLGELVRENNLTTSVWVPIVYNLVKSGVVLPSKGPSKPDSGARKIAPVQIDNDVIKIAKKNLTRRETNVYTYPACLLFLEQEHKRFLAYRRPYTVLLIRVRARNENGDLEIPSDDILKEVLKIVDKAKRDTDILAHYDTYDFALLLPETDLAGGQMIATRTKELISLFRLSDMSPEYANQQIDMAIGSATAPVDAETIGEILAVALAKRSAPAGT